MFDTVIIGCGIVGAAAAYELSRYNLSVAVLEKENDVSTGATKANSAIIHAGYDPAPGTLMAKLNVEGAGLAKELFKKLDIPHRKCGSMVLALSEEDLPEIQRLYDKGIKNGVPELAILSGEQAKELEPNLSGDVAAALLAPSAMIVSPWEYALALIETAVTNGVELHLECGVTAISKEEGGWKLKTSRGVVFAKNIINAAGVHSDTVHNMVSAPTFRVIPDRGEYYLLDKNEGSRVSRVIFQCPTKTGKGVLVSPTVHGNLIVGPSNEEIEDAENVATTASGLAWVAKQAKKSVPSLDLRHSIRNFSGVRAATDIDDFIIRKSAPGFIDLAGIKSPGLSAAPAIAKMAVELLRESGLEISEKKSYNDTRKRIRFAELSAREKAELSAKNPAYGRIICRCEGVTEGEILDSLHSPVPPRSVDAVKRRCNPGMGRCQGGFCGPKIVQILSEHFGIDPTAVLQDKAGTYILTGETKAGSNREGL